MKKILILIAFAVISANTFCQAISDNAVIPVSITLNPILRLNIVSGGNIEFVINTIDQYTNGIANSDRYDTKFTVASSRDFNVTLQSEDATFIGTDDATHTLALNNLGYLISEDGSGAEGTNWNFNASGTDDPAIVTNGAVAIITSISNNGAGDVTQNSFTINWELGTSNGANMNANSLLQQSIAPDRYTTNIFLNLIAQ
jgi:hypothetical protein